MNPFSGFMQAVGGLTSGFVDNTGSMGKRTVGPSGGDDTLSAADDNTRSFLAWVHNYMHNATTAGVDGESAFNLQPGGLDLDLPALDQLTALVAGARGQLPEDPLAVRLPDGQSQGDGQAALPQAIIDAIASRDRNGHPGDDPIQGVLTDGPEKRFAGQSTPADGQRQAAGASPAPQKAASAIPFSAGQTDARPTGENTASIGQTVQANDNNPTFQPAVAGAFAPAGPAGEGQMAENTPDWAINRNRPEEGNGKERAASLSGPTASVGHQGHTGTLGPIQDQPAAGQGLAGKAAEPATPQQQPFADQTRVTESLATGQPAASSEGDTADSRDNQPRHPAPRVELAEVDDEQWPKGHTSDGLKSTVSEQTRPQGAFQDTAKAMDPTTTTAVKAADGQPATLTRTEAAAVKSFQTTVMDQIVDKAAMRSIHGRSEIQIQLKPDFLGNVQMNIAAEKEQLVVRIMTDRPVVKEIIETHLHHLKTELQSQGLTIDKFDILVNPDANQQHSRDQFAQMFRHHFSQNSRQQSHGQDPEASNRDDGRRSDDERPDREGVNYFA